MNHECLGSTEQMRERRYTVLTLYLKGFLPRQIATAAKITIKQVYNDIMYIRTNPLHELHIDIIRDFGKSFFELKIVELEQALTEMNGVGTPSWVGTQKLIKEYKVELLKLSGASIERIEHKVDGANVHIYIPDNGRDE